MKIIDGGLSTELENFGEVINGELWTGQTLLSKPDSVKAAHQRNMAAGAEVVITASYQLSRRGFREIGMTDGSADEALRRSVEVARESVLGSEVRVAASIGPYGAVLHDGSEFRGDYKVSQSQLEDFHAERLEVILRAGPDLLAVETIPNVIEARALKNVLEKVEIPFWISFTAGSSDRLWSGEYAAEAAEAVSDLKQMFALGVNCLDPALVSPLVQMMHEVSGLPAVAYPNAGGTWDAEAGVWQGRTNKTLTDWLPVWSDTPIHWLGGCCGTDSRDIAQLVKATKAPS